MRFPDSLTIVARDRETGLRVEQVGLVLTLFAERKNNYTVGPLISNEKGEVRFTREECEFAIQRAQEMFVMDYSGDLKSCLPMIEVGTHPPENIQRMLEQHRTAPEFWGNAFRDPKALFEGLQNAKNAEYEVSYVTSTEAELTTNAYLELFLAKKIQM